MTAVTSPFIFVSLAPPRNERAQHGQQQQEEKKKRNLLIQHTLNTHYVRLPFKYVRLCCTCCEMRKRERESWNEKEKFQARYKVHTESIFQVDAISVSFFLKLSLQCSGRKEDGIIAKKIESG